MPLVAESGALASVRSKLDKRSILKKQMSRAAAANCLSGIRVLPSDIDRDIEEGGYGGT